MGVALARELRSDSGGDRDRSWDSFLFSAAVQNSHWLDATHVKRDHWSSEHRSAAKYSATDRGIRCYGSQLHQRGLARGRSDFGNRAQRRSPSFLLFHDWYVSGKAFSYTLRPIRFVRILMSFPVGFVIAAKLSPEGQSIQATRYLSTNAATTSLSRTTGMFLSSGQMIFQRFVRIRLRDRLFTLSDWPVCLATSCALIRRFFTSTAKKPGLRI